MNLSQERIAVMQHQMPTINLDERAERLVEAIKAETRWLLITTPARSFALDESHYKIDRAAFFKSWPGIRNQRMPPEALRRFYDIVSDQASILAGLIEVRRQRQQQSSSEGSQDDHERI